MNFNWTNEHKWVKISKKGLCYDIVCYESKQHKWDFSTILILLNSMNIFECEVFYEYSLTLKYEITNIKLQFL